jgi:hypothetical protein
MARPRHPDPHLEKAIQHAEARGWRFRKGGGHAFLVGYCPAQSRDGHMISIWSTPKNPQNHAEQIRRRVEACECQPPEESTEGE